MRGFRDRGTKASRMSKPVVVCCPDKFRGSLTARGAADALAAGVRRTGRDAVALPLADGGEGTLEVLCPDRSERQTARVTGPLGEPVEAEWGLRNGTAVVEMARASGLALAGAVNDPLRATTTGTGELIRAALDARAARVIVAVGGSATTDGGLGALEALGFDLGGAEVLVACDVSTTFVGAARTFGPQKGASGAMLDQLEERLASLAERYLALFGVDVRELPGAGAAGGLAGGLAAAGARLVPGAALVAEQAELSVALAGATLVLTGEGRLDATSFAGKVVGYVLAETDRYGLPAAVIAGDVVRREVPVGVRAVSLVEQAGSTEAAQANAAPLLADAAAELLARWEGREVQVSD
jgi:glycerate kinase